MHNNYKKEEVVEMASQQFAELLVAILDQYEISKQLIEYKNEKRKENEN